MRIYMIDVDLIGLLLSLCQHEKVSCRRMKRFTHNSVDGTPSVNHREPHVSVIVYYKAYNDVLTQ
jgi:hypothetical protein